MPRVSSVRQNVRGWPSPQKAPTGPGGNFAPEDYNPRTKNGRVRIVSPDQPLDSQVAILGARNDDRRGSGQRCEGLAQPAEREHAAAQRVQRVDQHNIPIALQTEMLESVVQQEKHRVQFPLHAAADFVAIGADPDMRGGLPHVHLRLISRFAHTGALAAPRNDHVQARFAAVSPRQDRRVPSRLGQPLRQMRHERRLPRPAHGERADADDRSIQLLERVRAMFAAWPAFQIAASGPRVSRASRV